MLSGVGGSDCRFFYREENLFVFLCFSLIFLGKNLIEKEKIVVEKRFDEKKMFFSWTRLKIVSAINFLTRQMNWSRSFEKQEEKFIGISY